MMKFTHWGSVVLFFWFAARYATHSTECAVADQHTDVVPVDTTLGPVLMWRTTTTYCAGYARTSQYFDRAMTEVYHQPSVVTLYRGYTGWSESDWFWFHCVMEIGLVALVWWARSLWLSLAEVRQYVLFVTEMMRMIRTGKEE
jgi:hypothetical protein